MSSTAAICCPPMFRAPITEDQATELADVLKAMAEPARLRLISIIASSPGGWRKTSSRMATLLKLAGRVRRG
jgi:ArsR family transcriptional regulator